MNQRNLIIHCIYILFEEIKGKTRVKQWCHYIENATNMYNVNYYDIEKYCCFRWSIMEYDS